MACYPASGSTRQKHSQPGWDALNAEFITHKNLTPMLLWQVLKKQDPYECANLASLAIRYALRIDRTRIETICDLLQLVALAPPWWIDLLPIL